MTLRTCSHKLGRFRSSVGVTLIELMIVVVIVGICAALAAPSYFQWIARTELQSAAMTTQSALTLAKMTARNRTQSVTVSWTGTPGQLFVITTDASGAQVTEPYALGNRITTALIQDDTGTLVPGGLVTFNPLGLRSSGPVGQPQSVHLVNAYGVTYRLTITPGGRIAWCAQTTC